MRVCELQYEYGFDPCEGKIEWHHVWEYAGKQINEVWAILAACKRHHDQVKTVPLVKRIFERRSLNYATEAELAKYPKKDWDRVKMSINFIPDLKVTD